MAPLIRAAASLALVLITGYAIVLIIFRARPVRNAAVCFAFSLGLGFGFLAVCCLLFLSLTGRVDFRVAYVASMLAAAGIIYEKRKAWLSRFRERFSSAKALGKNGCRERPALEKIAVNAGRCFVAIIVLVVAFNLLARPMYQYDSRAIWGLKARILLHERTIFSEAVYDISSNHPHPRYPLLLPIASAWVFHNMHEADDRAVRLLFLIFFIGLVLAAYQLQRTHAGGLAANASVAALLAAPFLYAGARSGASSGYADIILSFYITTSALAIILWMKENNRAFMIAGAMLAACAALTKNEGLVFALNLFLTTSIFSLAAKKEHVPDGGGQTLSARLKTRSSNLYDLAAYVVVVLAVLLPWLCVRARLPRFLDEDYLRYLNYHDVAAGLHRLPGIMKIFGAELLNVSNWGILWGVIAASLPGAGKAWRKETRFIALLVALQVASYLAIFVITPNDVTGQMRDSLPRLLLHVLPLCMALLSFQIETTVKE